MLYFPNWIYIQLDRWREMELDVSFVEEAKLHIARKMVLVGLWCIQINPSDRPSISRVLEMLEGGHESIEIPPKPFFPSSPRQRWELQTSSADNTDAVPLTDESL
ncbi:putative receptor-like protein kinase [Acorus calamus]|uniref:Receptor-like protein kinase n=1 Tax=Acorus calamus TaxID=4465 RepID=A0AAV9DCA6_ACOCL|nr:putative receptor-like protein kinase [Acorus calamus]